MQWFRLYAEIVDDEKLRLLAFEDRWHFVAILACKASGILDAGDPRELLVRKLKVKLGLDQAAFDKATRRLAEVGLIDLDTFQPVRWDRCAPCRASRLRPSAEAWMRIRSRIFERDDYRCQYCGRRGGALECDHVIPVSRGGSSDEWNLKTACRTCNRSKRDKLLSEWSFSS